jgi:hypothetical protein
MRGIFGLVGLMVALAIVGLLVKQQMTSGRPTSPVVQGAAGSPVPAASEPGNVVQQSQQVQQQVKQAMDAALQTRPMPDDK